MSKIDKILTKWKANPALVEKEEVFSVLERFGFTIESKSGSHTVISHEKLIGHPNFGLKGEFCIPVKHGRKVKGFYLKRVLEAIGIVQEEVGD